MCARWPLNFFLLFFFPLPFAKAPASPRSFQAALKIAALSAKCGRCCSRISWPREYFCSPPECKRSTLCCHPTCSACLLSWMVGEVSAAVISKGTLKTKEKVIFQLGSNKFSQHDNGHCWSSRQAESQVGQRERKPSTSHPKIIYRRVSRGGLFHSDFQH